MRGASLRTRIVALLLFLGLASPAATVWLVRERMKRLAREADAQRTAEALAEFEAAIAREAADVREALDRAAAAAARDARLLALRGARRGSAQMRDHAARLMQGAGLDCLTYLDPDGVILSSGHRPAAAGGRDAARLAIPEDGVVFFEERLEPGVGRALTLQSRRAVAGAGSGGGAGAAGDPAAHVAGGRLIDSAFLRRLSPGGTVRSLLLDQGGAVLAASHPDDPLPPPPGLAEAAPGANPAADPRERSGVLIADGVPHVYRARPIRGADGAPIGAVVAAVSQEGLARTTAALGRIAMGVGAAGGLAALVVGLALARGVTRPLRLLEEMTRRVARGEYDTVAAPGAPGEVGDLARAFNRMAGSLRDSRARLVQAERRAAAEDVARRVAHEIRNPLSPIALTLEGLVRTRRERPAEFPAVFEDGVRVIREEVRRMRDILDDFSRFGRLPPPRPRPCDLNDLIRGLLPLWSEGRARVEADLEPGLPPLRLDPDRMSEVIGNLVGNALQALGGEGGTVTIATRREDGAVLLRVRDTGRGLGEEALRRVFEPYFSTREGGTGLGLAIAHRLVTDHGGTIEAGNHPDGGAEFRIRLPLGDGAGSDGREAGEATRWPPS
jgi:signal transduction histidine kinase